MSSRRDRRVMVIRRVGQASGGPPELNTTFGGSPVGWPTLSRLDLSRSDQRLQLRNIKMFQQAEADKLRGFADSAIPFDDVLLEAAHGVSLGDRADGLGFENSGDECEQTRSWADRVQCH